MMHDIAVRCGNGTKAIGFGVSKVDHGEDHSVGFGEGNNLSTRARANRVVVSRMGGTCTSLGTSRANWVCSHVGGTCSRLQSRAVRTAGIGERLRLSRNHGGRSWLIKSRRRQEYHMCCAPSTAGGDWQKGCRRSIGLSEKIQPMRNSVRSSCVAASSCTTLCAEICNATSTESKETVQ